MRPTPITTLRVDRSLLAEIASDKAIFAAALQISSSLNGIRNTDPLLARLLEAIFEFIPADRGAVLLAGRNPGDLQPAAFHSAPFAVDLPVASQVFRDRAAVIRHAPTSLLCAPIGVFDSDLGVHKEEYSLNWENLKDYLTDIPNRVKKLFPQKR